LGKLLKILISESIVLFGNNNIDMAFKTPVLFIIFNRPEETRIVINKIKKLRPNKLFIAAAFQLRPNNYVA